MIRSKSIYDPKEEDDGIRILITRYRPRGIKKEYFDKWYKELSPSRDLLKRYKYKKIDFPSFGRLFLEEIQKSNVIEIWREILHESICHRKFIKKLCEQELSKV